MDTKATTKGSDIGLEKPFQLEAWLDARIERVGWDRHGLRTPVWIQFGTLGAIEGVMQATGGRLALGIRGMPLFDVRFEDVTEVRFPWWRFGSGVRFRAGGDLWVLSFVRPVDGCVPVIGELHEARGRGRRWRDALSPLMGRAFGVE